MSSPDNFVNEFEELDNNFKSVAVLKSTWDGRNIDALLQWMISTVNKTGVEIGVTLSIGSGLVSGTLIPLGAYYELFADAIATSFGGSEELRQSVLELGPAEPEEDDIKVPPQHVHLKDARTYLSATDSIPTSEGAIWRGKIAAVDGFTIGSLKKT